MNLLLVIAFCCFGSLMGNNFNQGYYNVEYSEPKYVEYKEPVKYVEYREPKYVEYKEPKYVEYSDPKYVEEYQQEDYNNKQQDYYKQQENRGRDYDQKALKNLKKSHEKYGAGEYADNNQQVYKDLRKEQAHKNAANANLQSSGLQEDQVKNSHDRNSYQREKKYGYEKAYGYEKESKNKDKADFAKNQANKYNHKENKAHFNEQLSALKDLESDSQENKKGAQSYGNRGLLVDLNEKANRGKEYDSRYEDKYAQDFKVVRQPFYYKSYRRPAYLKRYMPRGRNSFNGYFNGISGLGGLRGYGMGYGYNPIRYGSLDEYLGSELEIKSPFIDSYGEQYGYFSDSDI